MGLTGSDCRITVSLMKTTPTAELVQTARLLSQLMASTGVECGDVMDRYTDVVAELLRRDVWDW